MINPIRVLRAGKKPNNDEMKTYILQTTPWPPLKFKSPKSFTELSESLEKYPG